MAAAPAPMDHQTEVQVETDLVVRMIHMGIANPKLNYEIPLGPPSPLSDLTESDEEMGGLNGMFSVCYLLLSNDH